MLACRLLDLDESCGVRIDRLIGLKFPAYMVRHDNKVHWLLHQHRGAYDLWGSRLGDLTSAPDGAYVRQAIHDADCRLIPEAKACYTISRNVSDRLTRFCGISSVPLYHPPPSAEQIEPGPYGDYILLPSRVNAAKRQDLVVEAMLRTRNPVKIVFMGAPDDPAYGAELRARTEARLPGRASWPGAVNDAQKAALYSECLAVLFPPIDEDYGYVTLEAMLAEKAVITCADSGGPLEFVVDRHTGIISAPAPQAIADALDEIWENRFFARQLGSAGRAHYEQLNISWDSVVQCLIG
jgi:glycosyltransferase involved in cell wall biosynthesis